MGDRVRDPGRTPSPSALQLQQEVRSRRDTGIFDPGRTPGPTALQLQQDLRLTRLACGNLEMPRPASCARMGEVMHERACANQRFRVTLGLALSRTGGTRGIRVPMAPVRFLRQPHPEDDVGSPVQCHRWTVVSVWCGCKGPTPNQLPH
jgi:hypothetical protein